MTTLRNSDTRTMQTWPAGTSYEYIGNPWSTERAPSDRLRVRQYNGKEQLKYRPGTAAEWRELQVAVRAERYMDRDVLKCDSSLVTDLMSMQCDFDGSIRFGREWAHAEVINLYPDPSDWAAEECQAWLAERGISWDEDDQDNGYVDLINENAEAAEIYEWWAVTEWLAQKLVSIGEPVLDNAYGHWWGRTCTGQGMLMDGTLQQIAREID